MMPEIETGQINLTYPITFDPATFQQYNLPAYFGGFQVNEILIALMLRVNFAETLFLSCLSMMQRLLFHHFHPFLT